MSSPPTHPSLPVVAWLEPARAEFVRAVVHAGGWTLVGAGSSDQTKAQQVAAALGTSELPDLKRGVAALLAHKDAAGRAAGGLLVLSDPGRLALVRASDLASDPSDDARALAEARQRGVRIVTLEPVPASVLALDAGQTTPSAGDVGLSLGFESPRDEQALEGDTDDRGVAASTTTRPGPWASLVPLFTESRFWRDAEPILAQLGPLRAAHVECLGSGAEGSLSARVLDAFTALHAIFGEPERVDASFVAPRAGRTLQVAVPDVLVGLDGELSASLRYADLKCATLMASSRAGRWRRSLTLIGDGGRLRIFDDGLEWVAPDGRILDATRDAARIRGSSQAEPATQLAARVCAEHIARLMDPHAQPSSPVAHFAVLAAAQAALLSARTGEGESPATIARMAQAQ